MWAEAIAKLEGMESSKRERLWPQLMQGFKDLSQRLKVREIESDLSISYVKRVSAIINSLLIIFIFKLDSET